MKDWKAIAADMGPLLKEMRAGAPETLTGFSPRARGALDAGALDTKTKELIALAMSVSVRCDPCIAFHAKAAVDQGASRDEVLETVATAIYMGAGPAFMYAAQALEAFDQYSGPRPPA